MPTRRQLLFAMLYFCEGAPMGLLWLALPAYWKAEGMAVDEITALSALLVLPWTLKWVWGPVVDLTAARWPYYRWIIAMQSVMGLTLLPIPWIDTGDMLAWLRVLLLVHGFSAAMQDVAIDAMCISTVAEHERGSVNGWMQAGMRLGLAMFGGGALVLTAHTSLTAAIVILVAVLWSATLIVAVWGPRHRGRSSDGKQEPSLPERVATEKSASEGRSEIAAILRDGRTWFAFAFALVAGAAFESVGALLGPFLVERGMSLDGVGTFQLVLAGMIALGALAGGRMADRLGHVRVAAVSLLGVIGLSVALATVDAYVVHDRYVLRLTVVAAEWLAVGAFTASSYALFMDLSAARWKATLFSALMGGTNACEAGSGFVAGRLAAVYGYPRAFSMMVVPSLVGLLLLPRLRGRTSSSGTLR